MIPALILIRHILSLYTPLHLVPPWCPIIAVVPSPLLEELYPARTPSSDTSSYPVKGPACALLFIFMQGRLDVLELREAQVE